MRHTSTRWSFASVNNRLNFYFFQIMASKIAQPRRFVYVHSENTGVRFLLDPPFTSKNIADVKSIAATDEDHCVQFSETYYNSLSWPSRTRFLFSPCNFESPYNLVSEVLDIPDILNTGRGTANIKFWRKFVKIWPIPPSLVRLDSNEALLAVLSS